LGQLSHVQAHGRDDALPLRAEREAGAGMAGHYSPAFTLGTYVHLLSDDLPDADFLDATTASEDNGERDLASMETAIGAAVG
jgi:hypothetical protein